MCSRNRIHSIENVNLFNVFGVVAQIEKLDRENSSPQTIMQQALTHNVQAQEKIPWHLHQRWQSKKHHRFPAFENPFPRQYY